MAHAEGRRGSRWTAGVFAVLLGSSLTPLPEVAQVADAASLVLDNKLPSARDAMAVAWDGHYAWLFGGYDNRARFLDEVVRFDPATQEVKVMGGHLPTPTVWPTAAWLDGKAYIFGGVKDWSSTGHQRQILRYDPSTDTVTRMGAQLPIALTTATALSDGHAIYLFGGSTGLAQWTGGIVRYDPATDTATTVSQMVLANDAMGGVWDGEAFYLFGGNRLGNLIQRYDPGKNVASLALALLPLPVRHPFAVWNGDVAYIMGGYVGDLALNTVLMYHPGTDLLAGLADLMPVARGGAAAVWTGDAAYLFGGRDFAGFDPGLATYRADIVEVRPDFALGLGVPQLQLWQGWLRGEQRLAGLSNMQARVSGAALAVDGAAVLQGPGTPLPWTWDTTLWADGEHVLRAAGTVADGSEVGSEVVARTDNTPPYVAFTNPPPPVLPGLDAPTVVAGKVTVQADASDPQPGSGVARVAFAVDAVMRAMDTAAPFAWTWDVRSEALGEHVLGATATDVAGNERSVVMRVPTVPSTQQGLGSTLARLLEGGEPVADA